MTRLVPHPLVHAIKVPSLLLTLGLGLSLSACAKKAPPTAESEPAATAPSQQPRLKGTRVEVAVIQPSRGGLTMRVPGEVEGARDAHLGASMGGYIESVAVKEGEKVKQGAVLARVDSRTYSTRLVRAQVERDAASRELKRTESLGESIPASEIDAAQDRVANADAALGELQLAATRSVIVAPFSGVIVQVDAEVGEVAAPGVPLFRLVQIQPIRVSVALSDRDMSLAEVGMRALVETASSKGLLEGKIVQLSQAADLKTRSFEAFVELPNEDERLLPGMIAQVSLSTHTDTATAGADAVGEKLLISQDWLVTKPEGVGVFIAEEGVARFRPVELGPVVRREVEITGGVSAGDALIIVGHRSISEGDPILIHRQGTCCQDGRAVFGK